MAWDMLNKLGDIVSEPVKAVCDWVREPLKISENKRQKDKMKLSAKLAMNEREQKVELEIRQQQQFMRLAAEQKKWEAEIDDFTKRQEIMRNREILDAIVAYRRSMIEDAKDIAYHLSVMKIELAEKANELVIRKTEQYMDLQRKAQAQCMEQLKQIDEQFADNERMRIANEDIVLSGTKDIIDAARDFLTELKESMRIINASNGVFIDNAGALADGILRNMGNTLMGTSVAALAIDYADETDGAEIIEIKS